MVTEVVYNEWISSLFKVAHARNEDELKKIFDELVEKAGSRRSRSGSRRSRSGSKTLRKLMGGLKVKPSKYRHKNVTLRRRLVPSRPVYRRTTQQRVLRGSVQYLLILSSFIFIIYNAFNNPRMPNEDSRDPLLEFAFFNLFIPLVGMTGVIPPISEILLFLINFQTPIAIMRALTNVSNRLADIGNSELRAAQETVDDMRHLSKIAERLDRRLPPAANRGGPSAAESVVAAHTRPINRVMRLLLPEEALEIEGSMPIPRYEEFVASTQAYLIKKSLALSDGNKRRVMLLAMTGMTSRVVVLLTTPPENRGASSRRAGLVLRNMFSRVKGETAYKLIAHKTTAPGHYYTVCDSCRRTDENDEDEDAVTFSRACGNCSYDMCDMCYSNLQRRNPYSVSDDNYKVCPRCKHDI